MRDLVNSKMQRSEAVHPGLAWREQMARCHVTQAQMARQTGASHKHINQILQGNSLPSAALVLKMARVLYSDPPQANQHAWLLYTLQGKYLFEKGLREVNGWDPMPDMTHRNSHEGQHA